MRQQQHRDPAPDLTGPALVVAFILMAGAFFVAWVAGPEEDIGAVVQRGCSQGP